MKKATEIAKAILKLSRPEVGDAITNLKLQKLLYYCQGFNIALKGRPLFKEDILAWEHGPVVREVYDIYKTYSANNIPAPTGDVNLSKPEKDLIVDVWNVYGQFSAWRLRELTHNEAPWKETPRDMVITNSKLKSYFKTLVTNE